jgi:hypothetical protein
VSLAEQIEAIHDRLMFDEAKHRYTLDGKVLPGVTSIIGTTLAKGDAFVQWAANLARDGESWRAVSKREAAIGTQVHSVVEAWALRKLGLPAPPPALSVESAYLAAGLPEWLDASGIEPLCPPERRLYHPAMGYAGTADMVAMVSTAGRSVVRAVVDVKTAPTADTVRESWEPQVAAYIDAYEAHGITELVGYFLVIPKDGAEPRLVQMENARGAYDAFRALLSVYQWLKGRK